MDLDVRQTYASLEGLESDFLHSGGDDKRFQCCAAAEGIVGYHPHTCRYDDGVKVGTALESAQPDSIDPLRNGHRTYGLVINTYDGIAVFIQD